MAEEFVRFQDDQPIIRDTPVNSKAKAYEAAANTLGDVSQKAFKVGENLAEQESNSMYLQSVTQANKFKASVEAAMITDPDKAAMLAESATKGFSDIKHSSYVNKADRNRLNYYLDNMSSDVELQGVKMEAHQTKIMAAYTHFAGWKDQLNTYYNAIRTGQEKEATELQNAMTNKIKGLVSMGALTPIQAGNAMEDIGAMVGMAKDMHDVYGNMDSTARDYHTASSNPLNDSSHNNTDHPINGNTQWMIDYHNNDTSFNGVKADISRHMLPPESVMASLKPAQRQEAMNLIEGVREADGLLNSGEPFPVIEREMKDLANKGLTLTHREEGKKNYLDYVMTEFKNGNYLEMIGKTPAGGAINQNYMNNQAALDQSFKSGLMDENQYATNTFVNKNSMVQQNISYARGHHIPNAYVQPIPQKEIAVVQNAFNLNQQPEDALNILRKYNKTNQMYVANALMNPNQRVITQAISLNDSLIKPTDKMELIAANQDGRTYETLNLEKNGITDSWITTKIVHNLKDQMGLMNTHNGNQNGQLLQKSMVDTTVKYAKYLAAKNNDLIPSTTSFSKYVDQATAVYKNAYEIKSNTNYKVNPKNLPFPVSDQQLSVLAYYAIKKGNEYISKDQNLARTYAANDTNPLTMTITPTNQVIAQDGNGNVYYRWDLSNDLISLAKDTYLKEKKEVYGKNDYHLDSLLYKKSTSAIKVNNNPLMGE